MIDNIQDPHARRIAGALQSLAAGEQMPAFGSEQFDTLAESLRQLVDSGKAREDGAVTCSRDLALAAISIVRSHLHAVVIAERAALRMVGGSNGNR